MVAGPRQVGKTTLVRQVTEAADLPVRYASADEPTLRGAEWVVCQRGSSPELQVLNTALMSAQSGLSLNEARADREHWGRLVESAVGAHLASASAGPRGELFYWRERNREVDFVVGAGRGLTAIEVKSGRRRDALPGIAPFAEVHHPTPGDSSREGTESRWRSSSWRRRHTGRCGDRPLPGGSCSPEPRVGPPSAAQGRARLLEARRQARMSRRLSF